MGDKKKQQREDVSYKRDLDKLFSNDGQVPDRFKALLSELDESDEEGAWRDSVAALKAAQDEGFRPFVKAATQFVRDGHRLPDDEDLLVRLLDHPSERVLIPVLEHMLDMHERVTLERADRIKTRLKTVAMAFDDRQVSQLVEQLRLAL